MPDVKLSDTAFVDFTDGGRSISGTAVPRGTNYQPGADGKLGPKYWAANKGTELHWLQGACAHAKWDDSSTCTEAEFDAAVEGAKGIVIGEQAHHPLARFSSVVIDRSGTAHRAAPPPAVAPIPPETEPK